MMSHGADDTAALFAAMKRSAEESALTYVGLTLESARAKAESAGAPFRVGSLDGQPYMLTLDYVSGRVTAAVNDGVVTSCTVES